MIRKSDNTLHYLWLLSSVPPSHTPDRSRSSLGYRRLRVNLPAITPGAPSRQASLGEEDCTSMCETSHRNPVGNQSHLVRVSHPPEASLASSSVMAARSVDSECKSRVIEPRNKGWSQEPSPLGSRGQHRPTVSAWWERSCRGLRAGQMHIRVP